MSWAPPGRVRKIDLTADPPKVVRTWKERQPDLESGIVAVSEKDGRIFVLKREPPREGRPMPSERFKVLSADDLTPKQDFKLSLVDCNELATSRDGKYLYALDSEAAKVAVIDSATGREVKVLEKLGKYPYIMIALAEGKPEK
jgi:DNA-binding beta-propeller fold protein YncE